MTGTYSGDATFAASSGTTTETVGLRPTTTTPTPTPTSSSFGQSVSYGATVVPTTGAGTPTGTVQFYDGSTAGTLLDTQTLAAGKATSKAITSLALGGHNIVASYLGDGNFQQNDSHVGTCYGTYGSKEYAASQ